MNLRTCETVAHSSRILLVVLGVISSTAVDARAQSGPRKRAWDFESETPGKGARGFLGAVGRWEVVKDGENHVLAQRARNDDDAFNVALAEVTSYQDVDLSVRLRAVEGELDQGGGLVWRARDARNYYIARYNPLEDNFRVYKVEAGVRTQLQSAKVAGDRKWHVLRITMKGPKMVCYFDGEKSLMAEDSTFPGAGMVGLWSKADARTYFDDLCVSE